MKDTVWQGWRCCKEGGGPGAVGGALEEAGTAEGGGEEKPVTTMSEGGDEEGGGMPSATRSINGEAGLRWRARFAERLEWSPLDKVAERATRSASADPPHAREWGTTCLGSISSSSSSSLIILTRQGSGGGESVGVIETAHCCCADGSVGEGCKSSAISRFPWSGRRADEKYSCKVVCVKETAVARGRAPAKKRKLLQRKSLLRTTSLLGQFVRRALRNGPGQQKRTWESLQLLQILLPAKS